MTTELWIALLTFLTALVGGGRWLIYIYWSQARQIETLRKQNAAQYALRIEGAIDQHKIKLENHSKDIQELYGRLLQIQQMSAKNNEATAANARLISDYIESTAARFKKLETDFVALGNNMIMVKGGGNGSRN